MGTVTVGGVDWGERKINFGNGQFSTTGSEEKCPFNKIIANIWPRPCYFVGSVAHSMVVLLGAGIGNERAISIAFIKILRTPRGCSENFSLIFITTLAH